MSEYGVFAKYYDRLTENVAYEERAEYFRRLLSSFGVNGGVLIDLACGTGRLLALMEGFGFDVIGVDSSAEMLCVTQNNLLTAKTRPLLLCQKMQELDLYDTVDAVICSLDSINHLVAPRDVIKTFERVALFLNHGGIFIFDVNTLHKHKNILADNCFVYDLEDLFCVWQNSLDEKTDTVNITLDFFEKEGRLYNRSTQTINERAYSFEDLTLWLEQSGLTLLEIYDELKFTPPGQDCQRAVFVVRKG